MCSKEASPPPPPKPEPSEAPFCCNKIVTTNRIETIMWIIDSASYIISNIKSKKSLHSGVRPHYAKIDFLLRVSVF